MRCVCSQYPRAPWDPKVAQDLQGKRANEEQEESPALLDHSDPPERE